MQPQRRSIRLRDLNYAQPGLYFITICCHGRELRFGHVQNGHMQCNEFGMLAELLWSACLERFHLPNHHPMQIMPDHMHAIIELRHPVGATLAVARDNQTERAGASPAPTCDWPVLGDVVGAYKSMVMRACLQLCRERQQILGRFWQRNYYEHIIRDEKSYDQICGYILSNPERWKSCG